MWPREPVFNLRHEKIANVSRPFPTIIKRISFIFFLVAIPILTPCVVQSRVLKVARLPKKTKMKCLCFALKYNTWVWGIKFDRLQHSDITTNVKVGEGVRRNEVCVCWGASGAGNGWRMDGRGG